MGGVGFQGTEKATVQWGKVKRHGTSQALRVWERRSPLSTKLCGVVEVVLVWRKVRDFKGGNVMETRSADLTWKNVVHIALGY